MKDAALQILFEKDGETTGYVRYRELVPDNETPAHVGQVRPSKNSLRETFGHPAPPVLKLTLERA